MTQTFHVAPPDAVAAGVRSSLADLSTEGLDLVGLPEQRVRELVHEHLDYFQMMVGPSRPAEEAAIVTAVLRERRRQRKLPA
jgi:hypothetical protein